MADCVAECHSTTLDLSEPLFTPCLVVLKPYPLLIPPPPRRLGPWEGVSGPLHWQEGDLFSFPGIYWAK